MSFASRLDRRIKERRLSSQVVADRLTEMGHEARREIGREGVRSWRHGYTHPTVDYIDDLAAILEVSPEWLLTGREINPGTLAGDESYVLEAFRTARERGLTATDVVLAIGAAVDRLAPATRADSVSKPADAGDKPIAPGRSVRPKAKAKPNQRRIG